MVFTQKRTLMLTAVLAVALCAGLAYAKTICNACKGTGKILEVTKQCPLHQTVFGSCVNCDGSGLIGPSCPYCEGRGYILTPAEKEAEKKARAAADAKAQEESREAQAKMAVEKAKRDSVAATRKPCARSPASIQRVIMQNISQFRYAYSQRRRVNPTLGGVLMVEVTVDEFGKVISAEVVDETTRTSNIIGSYSSTLKKLSDPEFELEIVYRVKALDFTKIDKPGDVSTFTYPFGFSN